MGGAPKAGQSRKFAGDLFKQYAFLRIYTITPSCYSVMVFLCLVLGVDMNSVVLAVIVFVLAVGVWLIFSHHTFMTGVAIFVLWMLLSAWLANYIHRVR